MNLLVTGGAGFIGSHFVLRHAALYPKDSIIVFDKLTYAANKDFLMPVAEHITFVEGDIVDTVLLQQVVQEHSIDVIVDFAAESHVDRSIADPFPFIHTNVLGVQSIIQVCRKNPLLRYLHVSTDEVYGDLADADLPKKSSDPLWPSSPYAASKAAGDLLILSAMRTYGIKAAITRCTNNYGPHQADEKFIPTVIRSALQNRPIPIYAQGKNKRDWLFVTDHTDALELVLSTPWLFWDEKIQSGHILNISADDERQNIDVAKRILSLLQKPEDLLTFVADRAGHDWRYALDSSELRNLGWKPKVSFEEGLQKTIDWYSA